MRVVVRDILDILRARGIGVGERIRGVVRLSLRYVCPNDPSREGGKEGVIDADDSSSKMRSASYPPLRVWKIGTFGSRFARTAIQAFIAFVNCLSLSGF